MQKVTNTLLRQQYETAVDILRAKKAACPPTGRATRIESQTHRVLPTCLEVERLDGGCNELLLFHGFDVRAHPPDPQIERARAACAHALPFTCSAVGKVRE